MINVDQLWEQMWPICKLRFHQKNTKYVLSTVKESVTIVDSEIFLYGKNVLALLLLWIQQINIHLTAQNNAWMNQKQNVILKIKLWLQSETKQIQQRNVEQIMQKLWNTGINKKFTIPKQVQKHLIILAKYLKDLQRQSLLIYNIKKQIIQIQQKVSKLNKFLQKKKIVHVDEINLKRYFLQFQISTYTTNLIDKISMLFITEDDIKEIRQKSKLLPSVLKNQAVTTIIMELLGTFILVYGICCTQYLHPIKQKVPNVFQTFLISCFLYFALSLSAPFSGGHLNPSVTLALSLAGKVKKQQIKYYIVGQIVGGLIAVIIAYFLFDSTPAPYTEDPKILDLFFDMLGQILGTFLFTYFILYAVETNYMRGQYFLYLFISVMLLVSRTFTFRKGCINPAVAIALQIMITGVKLNFLLLVYTIPLIIGSLIGAYLASTFFTKFSYPLIKELLKKEQ